MKIRITMINENDCDVSELGDNPEEMIKNAWDAILKLWCIGSKNHDNGYVEKVEVVE